MRMNVFPKSITINVSHAQVGRLFQQGFDHRQSRVLPARLVVDSI